MKEAKVTKQCADGDIHPRHAWGHRNYCNGVSDYFALEMLAARHHDVLYGVLNEDFEEGEGIFPMWRDLSPKSKQARIRAMRVVVRAMMTEQTKQRIDQQEAV